MRIDQRIGSRWSFIQWWLDCRSHIAVDKCSSEVNEYALSRVNDHPLDMMSNTVWVEVC